LGATLLFATLLFQSQSAGTAEELQRGKNAYDRGEYSRAVEIVYPLLYPEMHLQSDGQIIQAHRILGVSFLFENKKSEAEQEFHKLLQLVPDYRFDALLDPPEVVDFFNSVRKSYASELSQLEARRKAVEEQRSRPTIVERRVGRNSFTVNFVPFGAGQFQNGQRKKGWAFLIAESTLGAVSIAAFASNIAVYGLRPQRSCRVDLADAACPSDQISHTDENRSRWLTRVQVGSGAMFFAAVAWGILDAIYYYRPETQLSLSAPTLLPSSTSIGSLRLAPAMIDRAIGPGLSFRF
jgi:hypothetical protein